jgi:hypothetical protein
VPISSSSTGAKAFASPRSYGARTASDSQKWHDINREKGEQQRKKHP